MIYYLAQDTLEWESLDFTYQDFLHWTMNGDLNLFYASFRWENWQIEIQSVKGNEVFSFYPFLYTYEGKDIDLVDKKIISIEENYRLTLDLQKQLKGK